MIYKIQELAEQVRVQGLPIESEKTKLYNMKQHFEERIRQLEEINAQTNNSYEWMRPIIPDNHTEGQILRHEFFPNRHYSVPRVVRRTPSLPRTNSVFQLHHHN